MKLLKRSRGHGRVQILKFWHGKKVKRILWVKSTMRTTISHSKISFYLACKMIRHDQHCRTWTWLPLIAVLLVCGLTTLSASQSEESENTMLHGQEQQDFQRRQLPEQVPDEDLCVNTIEFTELVPVVLEGQPYNVQQSEKDAMAISFRDTYNRYTRNLCDPLFRKAKSAALEIYPNGRANTDDAASRRHRHLQPGLQQSFNGEYTVVATQSNCNVTLPCDNTLFSGSFGRRRLETISHDNNKKAHGSSQETVYDSSVLGVDDEQRNLAWFSVNNGKCVCMAGEKWEEPDLDKFETNWYDVAVQELVDNGTIENISSQTIGESLVCRCGQSPSSSNMGLDTGAATFEQDENGIYVIPSNQYPCRCEDQDEFFFGKRDRQIRNRRLKTGGGSKGQQQQQGTSGGKGGQQQQGESTSECKARIKSSTFLCPPFSRS